MYHEETERGTSGGTELIPSSGSGVAVLFARADSIYKTMPGVDVWDAARDALKWPGGCPVITHPPCRLWGMLSHMVTRARPGERELAIWAISQIRKWGGVLEHPARSRLWPELRLPAPGQRDVYGGWTLEAPQYWWGHRCEKMTRFYVCGSEPSDMPELPFRMGRPTHVITQGMRMGHPDWRPHVPVWEREATPPALAEWLVKLARISSLNTEISGCEPTDKAQH